MKNLVFLKKSLIAHRGLHNKVIPENTCLAFEEAIKHGFIIEFDVHLLKDKEIIVYHDDNLKRLTGVDKKVKGLSLEEIQKLRILGKDKIPTLDEVLKLIDGKVPIIIEIKYDNRPSKLEKELVKYLDNYKGLFVIKSFNPFIVRWFKIHRPNYIRGLLLDSKNKMLLKLCRTNLAFNLCKPDFLSCDYKLYNHKLMKRDIFKLAWTIKTKENYDKYKNYFDNLICENILEEEMHKI